MDTLSLAFWGWSLEHAAWHMTGVSWVRFSLRINSSVCTRVSSSTCRVHTARGGSTMASPEFLGSTSVVVCDEGEEQGPTSIIQCRLPPLIALP